jgi:serine/threonine-protein kinase
MGASSSSTRTGSVLGTPHYMSPEQARGLRNVDYRSDLWSVAVITYRCVVGAMPFDGEAVGDLLVKLCTAPIPVPSQLVAGIPPGFDAWVAKALTREPAERFGSAAQLAESLAAVCGLSLRGQFAGGGSGAYSAISGARSAFGTGPNATVQSPQAGSSTGAPTTQTPAPIVPAVPRTSLGAIIAATLAAVVVLGIGAAVAVKKLSAAPPPVAAVSTELTAAAPLPAPSPAIPAAPAAPAATASELAPALNSAAAAPVKALPAKALPAARPVPVPVTHVPAAKPPAAKPNNGDIGF